MSETKWTKGPWEFADSVWNIARPEHDDSIGSIRSVGAEWYVAAVESGLGLEEETANAHLISAAPELYDFIATLENDDGKIPAWLWEKREALLKKARGEQ